MIKRFFQNHPWLYRTIKKNYWSCLYKSSRRRHVVYRSSDPELTIKLITKDNSVSKFIFLDSYEKETVSFLSSIVINGDIVYDIGANIGYYTLVLSKLVGETGRIHAFEPSFREFSILADNLQLNHLHNGYLNQLAVTDHSGMMEMSVMDDPAFGAYNTLGKPTHRKVENSTIRKEIVRGMALDDYCSAYPTQKPSIIKIDVEGAELDVLRGGRKLLSQDDSPLLVIEVCEATLRGLDVTPDKVIKMLQDYGYDLFSIHPQGYLVPFTEGVSLNLVAAKPNLQRRFNHKR